MTDPNNPLAGKKPPVKPLKKFTPLNQRLSFWLVVLAVTVIIGIKRDQTSHKKGNNKLNAVSVVLADATSRDVPIYLSALGNVTPTYTVTVKTQINGQLLLVAFKEGQMVNAGDLLADIDPRPYQAQLVQYEGQLIRDSALLANALIDLKRYQTLWKQDSVSQQTLATQVSLVKQYEGDVKNDEGLIQSVKVNLAYCHIISPVNGRIGLRLVDPGNFVQTSDTAGIAVVNTISPITVVFTIPEDSVPQVLPLVNADKLLEVKAYDRQQNKLLATGTLLTIDNQIDTTTGTVKLKANFENTDNHLFPNQFVNIKLLVNTLHNATVAPTAAIQHGANGDFVYLVKDDQTAHVQPIVIGAPIVNDTTITAGLLPGQSVVIEGADQLTDGAAVIVANPKPQPVKAMSPRLAYLWGLFK